MVYLTTGGAMMKRKWFCMISAYLQNLDKKSQSSEVQALEKRRMADYKLVVHAVDAYLTGKDTASYDPDTWFKDED